MKKLLAMLASLSLMSVVAFADDHAAGHATDEHAADAAHAEKAEHAGAHAEKAEAHGKKAAKKAKMMKKGMEKKEMHEGAAPEAHPSH